jgi:hypothetical protein
MSRNVPEKALIATFSETASLESGSSSGTLWDCGGVAWKPRFDVLDPVHSLPGYRLPEL